MFGKKKVKHVVQNCSFATITVLKYVGQDIISILSLDFGKLPSSNFIKFYHVTFIIPET